MEDTSDEEKMRESLIGRIDQSIVHNLSAIRDSYGDDAGVVKDFIVFMGNMMKVDLFGFTEFTLAEFCQHSGRSRQEMSAKHPVFENPKIKPPFKIVEVKEKGNKKEEVIFAYTTVFDYILYQMQLKNIVFAKSFEYKAKGQIIRSDSFQVIKSVEIHIDNARNGAKIYQVRLSDDFMTGFVSRYFTLESTGYTQVGKGRGGDGRKSLYIYLMASRHLLLSQKHTTTWFSVDYLAGISELNISDNKRRKEFVKKHLEVLKDKGQFSFEYEFVSGDGAINKALRGFWVKIDFSKSKYDSKVVERPGDHLFYIKLLTDLQAFFKDKYRDVSITGESDHFQRWLTNKDVDIHAKAQYIMSAYTRAYQKNISFDMAVNLIDKLKK